MVDTTDPLELQFYRLSSSSSSRHPCAVSSIGLGDFNGLDPHVSRQRLRIRIDVNSDLLLIVIVDMDNAETAFVAVVNWIYLLFGLVSTMVRLIGCSLLFAITL